MIFSLPMIAGWIGALLLLTAYLLVSLRRLAGNGVLFQVLNVAGSAGLAWAAIAGGVWPAVALNVVWIAIGLFTLVRHAIRRHTGTPEGHPLPEDGQGK